MSSIVPFEEKSFELLDSSQYEGMLEIIRDGLRESERATGLFQKSQSQFMDNMLTLSHITPIRNLRQILAEMKKIRLGLGEAYYSIEKKKLDIEEKREMAVSCVSLFAQKRYYLEIEELEWQISCITENVGGAIRKLANYTLQYRSIIKDHNLGNFNEIDFEEEEERYHITKAFEQGLSAARSRGGFIDEGNQIYLDQIGINGTVAQVEVANYLNYESKMLSLGNVPTHEMQLEWLLSMAEKFKGCSKKYAEWKGMPDTKSIDALISYL